jgi:flagellar motor switch protein FliG
MKTMERNSKLRLGWVAGLAAALLSTSLAQAANSSKEIETVQRQAELHVRNLLEPLLDKYCRDQCKLMAVSAQVDLETPDQLAPGFDDIDPRSQARIVASSARAKILMDEKVGPISRGKLMDLVQQYLDTLDFPVRVETQIAHFPAPIGSAAKVAELRERVTKQFKNTVDELFSQFCPGQCMLADYELQTEIVNSEEASYGGSREFIEDAGIAIRVKNVAGTLLVDEELLPEERQNVLEMAKLKTNYLKNVNLTLRSLKFPKPVGQGSSVAGAGGRGGRGLASTNESKDSKTNTSQDSRTSLQSSQSLESKSKLTENSTTNSNSNNSTNATSTNNSNNTNNSNETSARQERFERIEKIERVESGDAVQQELQKFKVFGLIFACSVISLLIFLAMASYRPRASAGPSSVTRVIQQLASDPINQSAPAATGGGGGDDRTATVVKRYEIERLKDELMSVFAQQPRVAKQVFSRVLTEEGVEITANYVHIFGESVVMDMLRDPSLQNDMSELMEFYAKNPIELKDEDQLELLRALHNRTIAGKLVVMGSRSSQLFDFLADMDGLQIMELVRNESLTVKSIVMTQCDPQKRQQIFAQMDEKNRMALMAELSRIDYLPRDYISNVANALKRKRRENPKLNTEALPGSEVLITLLERTGPKLQKTVVKNLEASNPESARAIKSKLVSTDTLRHLRDGQLLEVVLSLKHDELLQFLKGAAEELRRAIFAKCPKDLVSELEEELATVQLISRETYVNVERKILNRLKIMANEGLINLVETNERMFANGGGSAAAFVEAGPADSTQLTSTNTAGKAAGW